MSLAAGTFLKFGFKLKLLPFIILAIFILAACAGENTPAADTPAEAKSPVTAVPATEPAPQPTDEPAAPTPTEQAEELTEVEAVPNYLQPRYEPLEECFIEPPEEFGIEQKLDCGYHRRT